MSPMGTSTSPHHWHATRFPRRLPGAPVPGHSSEREVIQLLHCHRLARRRRLGRPLLTGTLLLLDAAHQEDLIRHQLRGEPLAAVALGVLAGREAPRHLDHHALLGL